MGDPQSAKERQGSKKNINDDRNPEHWVYCGLLVVSINGAIYNRAFGQHVSNEGVVYVFETIGVSED